MRPKILIVDDEQYMLELIETILRQDDAYETRTVSDPKQVMGILDREFFNLVLLDLKMPGMGGMELLELIRKRHPQAEVVIVTAYGTIPLAVESMQAGAANFITKPFNKKEILLVVEKVLEWQSLKRENRILKKALAERYDFRYLAGPNKEIRDVFEQARRLAQTDGPVYLEGEIGTGKSFLARAIHYHSPRSGGPFKELNVSAVSRELIPALLFGQSLEGGESAPGLVDQAAGGTLYLSDVQSLNTPLQKRLVRLLEEGEYEAEGSLQARRSDVRLVLAGQGDLDGLAGQGLIDQEFRIWLGKFPLVLPPLRNRRDDIPALFDHFLEHFGGLYGKDLKGVDPEALEWLVSQDWPGNLREMENIIERAVVLARGDVIGINDLQPTDRVIPFSYSPDPSAFDRPHQEALEIGLGGFQQAFETRYLDHCLAMHKGNLEKAAEHAGLSPIVLNKKLARFNLNPDSFKSQS